MSVASFYFSTNETTTICDDLSSTFKYNGLYRLNSTSCQIEIVKNPENAYLPILYAFLALIIVQIIWNICSSKPGKISCFYDNLYKKM